ncbi:unnamed protein product [Linum trigynum]|uniref:Cytochrome P450 n=1 Tax=Linum trigynum TaxID=586398 RepID=A0AAV2FXL1_9ROSI
MEAPTDFSSLAPLLLAIAITLLFSLNRFLSPGPKNLPPGSLGWPVIGETLQFLFGTPEKFISHRMKKHSPQIFKTNILGENTVVLCGPAGHKFLFSNEQTIFTVFRPHSIQKLFREPKARTVIQPNSAGVTKLMRSPGFLKPEALVRYVGKMDSFTQNHIRAYWEGRELVHAFPLAKSLTLSLACSFFLGTDDPTRIARLVGNFDDVAVGLHSFPLNFPGTVFRRSMTASGVIRGELIAIIREKKAAIAGGAPLLDILSHLIVATDPSSGNHMAESEIAGKVMGLLVAGYSTVATAITFFLKYVGERSDIYAKVLAEHREISGRKKAGEMLEWDDFQGMKYSWNVVQEVMRLTPPLQGAFREALTEFSYGGYTVPKGWKVYWTVSTANMDPDYFPDPERFDPSRHEVDNNKTAAFAFVPFGGGPRMCAGKEYARLAILTFVHNVVTRFKWEAVVAGEKVVGDLMPTPQLGLPLRLQQH